MSRSRLSAIALSGYFATSMMTGWIVLGSGRAEGNPTITPTKRGIVPSKRDLLELTPK